MLTGNKKKLTKQSSIKELLDFISPGATAITFNRVGWLKFKMFFDSLPDDESGVCVA